MHLKHKQQKNSFETQTAEAVVEAGPNQLGNSQTMKSHGAIQENKHKHNCFQVKTKHNFIQVETN